MKYFDIVQIAIIIAMLTKLQERQGRYASNRDPRLTDQLLNRYQCAVPYVRVVVCHQLHHACLAAEVRHESAW